MSFVLKNNEQILFHNPLDQSPLFHDRHLIDRKSQLDHVRLLTSERFQKQKVGQELRENLEEK